MFLKVISYYVEFKDVDECIYELSINDAQNIYIRKSVYEKLNDGTYSLLFDGKNYIIYDKDKVVPKLTSLIY